MFSGTADEDQIYLGNAYLVMWMTKYVFLVTLHHIPGWQQEDRRDCVVRAHGMPGKPGAVRLK